MLSTINMDNIRFPTRTPGRRTENTKVAGFPTTIRKVKNDLVTKTPLHPASAQQKRLFKDSKPILGTVTRPLGDKTPLPNRLGTVAFQTPFNTSKALKTLNSKAGHANTPGSLERPSSQRRHSRLPRTSYSKNFETPANNDCHWELSDSDVDLPAPDVQSVLEENIARDERDLDEIEYCAPNTLDLPYQPPFDFELPDYGQIGKALRDLAFSAPFDDSPGPPEHDFPASDVVQVECDLPPLAPLESDDPFELARLQLKKSEKPIIAQKANVIIHRRVKSSQPSFGTSTRTSTQVAKGTLPKASIPILSRPSPLQPSSTIEKGKTTKPTEKPGILQRTSQLKTRPTSAIFTAPSSRPQTSFSLASRREPSLRPKSVVATVSKTGHSRISKEPFGLDLKTFNNVYEDFVFDV